jgi:N-acetylglucosaminyldiphosphoundecaprenol N-acetyl-beta-D-mannosaminyltransferase
MKRSPVPARQLKPSRLPETVELLGLRFHNLTRAEAAKAIAGLAGSGHRAYVVKPYSEFMPRAVHDARVREVLAGAALCLPDGIGILWAAHYLSLRGGSLRALWQLPLSLASLALNPAVVRHPLRENMAGVDLTWAMLAELETARASVFLLGGTVEESHRARKRIEARFPRLRIAGARPGYFKTSRAENDTVVAEIKAAAPQALLVAMGFPLQERWIADNLSQLNVNVAIAEGGSFSFISGTTRRAPGWMRRAGLEWLFRLLRQPSRLRRQLALPVFVWLVLRERLRSETRSAVSKW